MVLPPRSFISFRLFTLLADMACRANDAVRDARRGCVERVRAVGEDAQFDWRCRLVAKRAHAFRQGEQADVALGQVCRRHALRDRKKGVGAGGVRGPRVRLVRQTRVDRRTLGRPRFAPEKRWCLRCRAAPRQRTRSGRTGQRAAAPSDTHQPPRPPAQRHLLRSPAPWPSRATAARGRRIRRHRSEHPCGERQSGGRLTGQCVRRNRPGRRWQVIGSPAVEERAPPSLARGARTAPPRAYPAAA